MKINSITSFNYNSNNVNFKRTAVPYPEYENAYHKDEQQSFEKQVTGVINKISALFSPSNTKEAANIKAGIDNIYTSSETLHNETPQAQLLSVLA